MRIEIKILDKENKDEVQLNQVFDLYQGHPDFDIKERELRGLNSVEAIKKTIQDNIKFIIAVDTTKNLVVAVSRLNMPLDKSRPVMWHNSLWVKDSDEYRRKGIGQKMMEQVHSVYLTTKTELESLALQCGIAPENEGSKKFHTKLNWNPVKKGNSDTTHTWQYDEKTYELWQYFPKKRNI